MTSLRILSIAVIGKHGNPLYLESFSNSSNSTSNSTNKKTNEIDLKWHYAAHTALDFFEERELPAAKTTDTYLGLLYAMEDYAVYGYQSNTRIKFVLILALVDAVVRDMDVKTIFRAIHNAYINYISNPFSNVETDNINLLASTIKSFKFNKAMNDIAGIGIGVETSLS